MSPNEKQSTLTADDDAMTILLLFFLSTSNYYNPQVCGGGVEIMMMTGEIIKSEQREESRETVSGLFCSVV
jgi:hypothetical protein